MSRRTLRRCGRSLPSLLLALAVVATASPAAAGGIAISPVAETSRAGGTARLVGYSLAGDHPWAAEPDLHVVVLRRDGDGWRRVAGATGTVAITRTHRGGFAQYRIQVDARLPDAIDAGEHTVGLCATSCASSFDTPVAGRIWVGDGDPPRPVRRAWPRGEPEIVNLAPDAVVIRGGHEHRAGDLAEWQVARHRLHKLKHLKRR